MLFDMVMEVRIIYARKATATETAIYVKRLAK
jgi:uncharacterized DUF497 family protein